MDEKLIRDLSDDARRRMTILLTPPAPGKDWKTLACKMGYTNEEINYIACFNERAVTFLLKDYENRENRGEKTVSELLSLLEDMKRKDVIEDLQNFIATTPTPTEIENRQKKMDEHERNKTFSESYDAFVSYAAPDRPFAKEIVRRLEGKPYHMRVCIDDRDFVPGGCYFDAAAAAIEKRCKKVLVVLSENFNNSENADQQAKIALSLSPGAKKQFLIPILYKACCIPTTLRFITYLDYTRDDSREFFWDKLAKSLGYIDKNDKTSVKPVIRPTPAKKTGARTRLINSFKKSTRV